MHDILFINGKVNYSITLDPSVWIFDDRKVDLTTYFQENNRQEDDLEQYTKNISAHWDREIREGAVYPPVNKSISKFEKEKIITGTFGMPLWPFIQNAEAKQDASGVEIHTETNVFTISLEQAKQAILGFSKDGRPLKEDGPVHFYFGDGSNMDDPIKCVRQFTIV
ncbi:MAG: peptidyl-prolyl cis-trans isomerase [Ectobacillus sp.]